MSPPCAGRHAAAVPHCVALLWLIQAGGCSRCPSAANDADVGRDFDCTEESCSSLCLDALGCSGRCREGTCFCTCADGGDSADVGVDDGPSDLEPDDAREHATDDRGSEDAGDCTYRSSGETRPESTPELQCHRLSVDQIEYGLMRYSGDGPTVVAVGGPDASVGLSVWSHDRTTTCWSAIPEVAGPGGERRGVPSLAVEGGRLAFWSNSSPEPDIHQCELRLLDLDSREVVILDSSVQPVQPGRLTGCTMDSIVLEYPWVVWRDMRRVSDLNYPSDAMAKNIETGETINLSIDPATGRRDWTGVVEVDLKGGLAVFGTGSYMGDPPRPYMEIVSADLRSGERRAITDAIREQFHPAVTEDWVAWVDLRNDDTGSTSFIACLGDIYGYDRRTGTERTLVTEGDVMHGPWVDAEGPWLVYTDQRWDASPRCDSDREASVVAFHLPTSTEIRITDWPGSEGAPKVYRREDGAYGILLIEELSYSDGTYRLWDCDLPVM
ncbi:MAG: hypothetical protein HY905_09910 [Deltaproteobacteria bacterium]|nr:hypothetical protein [Deltaproteobacteria bacterium]